jgi:general secretion pathway protein H
LAEVSGFAAGLPGPFALSRAARQARGFTLIELLVVLIVVGVVVASIQLNLFSDDARRLRNEGERLAALLTALADESVTSGMPLAVSFDDDGYTFWERPIADAFGESAAPVAQDDWRARPGDELFSSRELPEGMRIAEVRVRQRVLSQSERAPERVAFSPSGVHQPFSVLLALGDLRVQVLSDALGNLRVVDDADEDAD